MAATKSIAEALGHRVGHFELESRHHAERWLDLERLFRHPRAVEPLVATLVAAAVLFVMTAPAAYVLMLGVLVNFALGWPLWLGVATGTALSIAYVFRGGLKAVVATDVVQFFLMFIAFAVLVVLGSLTMRMPPVGWAPPGFTPPEKVGEGGEAVLVMVRVVEDMVTISVDTSGEPLHRRGWRRRRRSCPSAHGRGRA